MRFPAMSPAVSHASPLVQPMLVTGLHMTPPPPPAPAPPAPEPPVPDVTPPELAAWLALAWLEVVVVAPVPPEVLVLLEQPVQTLSTTVAARPITKRFFDILDTPGCKDPMQIAPGRQRGQWANCASGAVFAGASRSVKKRREAVEKASRLRRRGSGDQPYPASMWRPRLDGTSVAPAHTPAA